MGFMDKAKKLAEQAQAKLDEAQQQFNQSGGSAGAPSEPGPAVEYDQHGRPIAQEPTPTPTPTPTPAPAPAPPEPAATGDAVGATPGMGTAPPAGAPAGTPAGPPEASEKDDYEPPKLSSGDPLAG